MTRSGLLPYLALQACQTESILGRYVLRRLAVPVVVIIFPEAIPGPDKRPTDS